MDRLGPPEGGLTKHKGEHIDAHIRLKRLEGFHFFISGTLLEAFFLDCQALLQNDGAYACAQGKAPWMLLEQTWLALAL